MNELPKTIDFSSIEELKKYLYNFYIQFGVIMRTTHSSKVREIITLACDRSGKYRNKHPERNKRKSTIKAIGCKFKVSGGKVGGIHKILKITIEHTNPLDKSVIDHPFARRLSEEECIAVDNLSKINTKTLNIMTYIEQKFSNHTTTIKNIYNRKYKIESIEKDKKCNIEILLEYLESSEYIFNYKTDENGSIEGLFFTTCELRELSLRYKSVFVLNSTYKTNYFKFPLLNIVGITSTFHTLYSCFVFIKNETAELYNWAIQVCNRI